MSIWALMVYANEAVAGLIEATGNCSSGSALDAHDSGENARFWIV